MISKAMLIVEQLPPAVSNTIQFKQILNPFQPRCLIVAEDFIKKNKIPNTKPMEDFEDEIHTNVYLDNSDIWSIVEKFVIKFGSIDIAWTDKEQIDNILKEYPYEKTNKFIYIL
jgi:hypothetical protein